MADPTKAAVGIGAVDDQGYLVAFDHAKRLLAALQQPTDAVVVHLYAPGAGIKTTVSCITSDARFHILDITEP